MLCEHLGYVADRVRLNRFKAALAIANPGDCVADLGCGSGILGLLCLQAGASRVICIDSSAMIQVARETLARAGYADRVSFIRDASHRIDLPEPVDMVICDHVGYFGFDYGIVETLADARRRFLKAGGTLIPSRIRLHLGAVDCETAWAKANGWTADEVPPEFHWLRQYSVNAKHAVEFPSDSVLGAPETLGEIDLYAENPEYFRWSASLTVARDGMLHGLAGWFECELAEEVWMTNSPLADGAIRRPQAFLPIEEPVPVKAGDRIEATIMARPADHLIGWFVELPSHHRRFSHSTWQGMLLAREDLIRAHPERVPSLSRQGQARLTVLGYCDGQRTALEIEHAVLSDHPGLLPSPAEISRFVHQTLGRDTE
jgi:SAM-dependent methyltransferase